MVVEYCGKEYISYGDAMRVYLSKLTLAVNAREQLCDLSREYADGLPSSFDGIYEEQIDHIAYLARKFVDLHELHRLNE